VIKKIFLVLCLTGVIACNSGGSSKEQKTDTSASSFADSIKRAAEQIKADSSAAERDSLGPRRDSLKK